MDDAIWRYMDLARFAALLSKRAIRFTRVSTYKDDPWEGYCEVTVPDFPADVLKNSPGHQVYKAASDFTAKEFRNAGDRLYVSCWCRWSESMPMWDLYGSRGTGVAITSSPARFVQVVDRGETRKEQWKLGVLQYHDDIRSAAVIQRDLNVHALQSGPLWQSVIDLAFQKRRGFQAENEWRAALYQPEKQKAAGVEQGCDLAVLIDEVVIGPRADPFVVEVVTDLLVRYELDKPVRQSNLLQAPVRPAEPA